MKETVAFVVFFCIIVVLGVFFLLEGDSNRPSSVEYQNVVNRLSDADVDAEYDRVSDLLTVVDALEQYQNEHYAYPESSNEGNGWDGLYSSYGESSKDWVSGLVPKYLSSLPRDPRGTSSGSFQYLYRSNGADFKLISHSAPDCEMVKKNFPSIVDPRRDCTAYGFWTEGAVMW